MNRLISIGEVRLALRLIVKQPILSGTIILALVTGICLATMGFTFRDELVNSTIRPSEALSADWQPATTRAAHEARRPINLTRQTRLRSARAGNQRRPLGFPHRRQ